MTTKTISATESAPCADEALCCPPEDSQTTEVAKRPAVQQVLSDERERSLPLNLVNESVVSKGRYLSRAQLASAVGQGQGWERSAA